jgi:hypothetical protein
MVEPDNTFIHETLKKIQAGIAELRNGQADLRRDVRDLKASNAMILGLVGEMVKGSGRENERLARIEARLDHLEHHLTERDQPPT